METEFVLGLCDRWHKTPDEIFGIDISVLRMLEIERLMKGETVG